MEKQEIFFMNFENFKLAPETLKTFHLKPKKLNFQHFPPFYNSRKVFFIENIENMAIKKQSTYRENSVTHDWSCTNNVLGTQGKRGTDISPCLYSRV